MSIKYNQSGTTSGDYTKLDNQLLAVHSQEIWFVAQPITRFLGLFQMKDDLSRLPGQTITFLRYANLTGDPTLTEVTDISTVAMSSSTMEITVSERGLGTAFTEFLLRTSIDDLLTSASQLLGMHYSSATDAFCRDVLLASPNTLYGGARSSRAGLIDSDAFSMALVKDAVEALATNKAPKFSDGAYRCVLHPHQSRKLRDDPGWVNVANYAQPENMLAGEIGRIDDVRFLESTNVTRIVKGTQDIWADNADTTKNTSIATNSNTDVYQAIICGDYGAGFARALPVEMREDAVADFGRKRKLAWYTIDGAALLETGHVFTLETA